MVHHTAVHGAVRPSAVSAPIIFVAQGRRVKYDTACARPFERTGGKLVADLCGARGRAGTARPGAGGAMLHAQTTHELEFGEPIQSDRALRYQPSAFASFRAQNRRKARSERVIYHKGMHPVRGADRSSAPRLARRSRSRKPRRSSNRPGKSSVSTPGERLQVAIQSRKFPQF